MANQIILTGKAVKDGLKVLNAPPQGDSKVFIVTDEEVSRKVSISALHNLFSLGYNDRLKETGYITFYTKEYFGVDKLSNTTFYNSIIINQLELLKGCKGYIDGKVYEVVGGYKFHRGVFKVS